MTIHERKVLVVGLPQTGKTTFLAALWSVVGSNEVEGSLRLEKLEGDKQHLNEIRDLWADCDEIPRTRVANECIVSMRLNDVRSDTSSEFFFPDMDGESFQRHWTDRLWSTSYRDLVRESSGVLLFIHPAKVKESPLIREAQPLVKRLATDVGRGKDAESQTPSKAGTAGSQTVPTDPLFAPTQVQLVELLQFIGFDRERDDGVHLGVIVSAWDIVMKQASNTPEDWLAQRLPLLYQFLVAHSDTVPFQIFGVSAQGGDLKDAQQLRQSVRPSERIIVMHGAERSHDITTPVRWVMVASDEASVP